MKFAISPMDKLPDITQQGETVESYNSMGSSVAGPLFPCDSPSIKLQVQVHLCPKRRSVLYLGISGLSNLGFWFCLSLHICLSWSPKLPWVSLGSGEEAEAL